MRKCIATVSVSGALVDKLDAIAAARFDAIEVFENDLINFPGTPDGIRKQWPTTAASASTSTSRFAISMRRPTRSSGAISTARSASSTSWTTLGAPMILVCSNASPRRGHRRRADRSTAPRARGSRRAAQSARRATRRSRGRAHVNHYEHAWSIVEAADHPQLGIVIDSFHILSLGDEPEGIAAIPGEKIFFLQMADAPRLAMDVLQWSRHYRCFPGPGAVRPCAVPRAGAGRRLHRPFFARDLQRRVPRGAEPAHGGRRDAVDPLLRGADPRSGWRRDDAGSSVPRERAAAHARAGRAVRSAARRRSFRASRSSSSPSTRRASGCSTTCWRALGFRRAGRHRSKHVTLYRQGAINLILNAEPDSFARLHFADHGPSVCAIGVATDDSVRALNRATALHCPRFDSRLGPNELTIPAVRTPGGSLVYFVPATANSRRAVRNPISISPAAPQANEAGRGPDSASTTSRWRCRSRRSTRGSCSAARCSAWKPARAWSCRTRSAWFAAAASRRPIAPCAWCSTSRRAAARRWRAPSPRRAARQRPSHRVRDRRHLRHDGAARRQWRPFRPISPNYYDDLAARFDLAPDLVAQHARARASSTSARPRASTFMRIHKASTIASSSRSSSAAARYDGYGAQNAPARLAAQVAAQHIEAGLDDRPLRRRGPSDRAEPNRRGFMRRSHARPARTSIYDAILAPLDGFGAAVAAFRAAGGRGLNVTVPFKLEAFALANERSQRAQEAGAVNTLRFDGDARARRQHRRRGAGV